MPLSPSKVFLSAARIVLSLSSPFLESLNLKVAVLVFKFSSREQRTAYQSGTSAMVDLGGCSDSIVFMIPLKAVKNPARNHRVFKYYRLVKLDDHSVYQKQSHTN